MKTISAIVVICLFLSATPLVCVRGDVGTQVPSFVTLDVCHASGAGILTGADTVFVHEFPCKPVPVQLSCPFDVARFSLKPFLIASLDSHPPES